MRVVLAIVLLTPLAAAQTITVGPSGADHTEIQSAIDAAPVGATILVAPGQYAAFTLAKPLDLIGAGSALVDVGAWNGPHGSVVQEIPAGAVARVTGFSMRAPPCPFFGPFPLCSDIEESTPMMVRDSEGTVVLHDIRADWGPVPPTPVGLRGLGARDAALVIVDRSQFGTFKVAQQSTGLFALRSSIWLTRSEVRGASGASGLAAFAGSDAARVEDSILYISQSELLGGLGGTWSGFPPLPLAAGTGIVSTNSTLKLAGGGSSSLDGHHGMRLTEQSFALIGAAWTGAATIFTDATSSFAAVPQVHPWLHVEAVRMAPGDATTMVHGGPVGSVAVPFLSLGVTSAYFVPGIEGAGALALTPLLAQLPGVSVGPAGQTVTPFAIPPFAGLVGQILHVQSVQIEPSGALAFSNPVAVPIL